jgi:hypothetical protein
MEFKFKTTYYAIITPRGDVIAPSNADHNGLYERKHMAQKYLDQKIKDAKKVVTMFEKCPPRTDFDKQNQEGWIKIVADLEQTKIVPVEVVIKASEAAELSVTG